MYSIDILVEEHNNILRLIRVVRKACLAIIGGAEVNLLDFHKMIDFIRGYADTHHHGKEEKILFAVMQEQLGQIAVNLIKHGMFVEHELGRLHVMELENALNAYEKNPDDENKLDIISNAMGYAKLLTRHIDKENAVVFTYGEKNMNADVLEEIDNRTREFEEDAQGNGIQESYLKMLDDLEQKYF